MRILISRIIGTNVLPSVRTGIRSLSKMANVESVPQTSFGCMGFGQQMSDLKLASQMVKVLMDEGCFDFDTAYMYGNGKSEEMMGDMELLKDPRVYLATKANPWNDRGLQYDNVIEQLDTSLERLKRKSVDLFYLHAPDHNYPIEETLKAVDKLYKDGKFKEFGLSNYPAWQVVEIYYICKNNNYILPTVYQGMYNAFTRVVEKELFPCLRRFGIRFYAFNPLAGGLLTGKYKFSDKDEKKPFGRFFGLGKTSNIYQDRFWHKPLFDAIDMLTQNLDEKYGKGTVTLTEASLRWIYHHSQLSAKYGDKVILGASSMAHLEQNLKASQAGPLDEEILEMFDEGWQHHKGICPDYTR